MKAHRKKHKEIRCEECVESIPYYSATSHKTIVRTKLTNVRSVLRFTRERTNWKFIQSYPDPTAPHFQSLISLQPTKAFMRLFWCVSGIWGWEVFTTAHKVILAATSPSQMGNIAFILRGAAPQIWISQKWCVTHLGAKNPRLGWDIRRRVQVREVWNSVCMPEGGRKVKRYLCNVHIYKVLFYTDAALRNRLDHLGVLRVQGVA